MVQRRILAVMNLDLHSRRAMLEGFNSFALEQGWAVVRLDATLDLDDLIAAWDPAAILICPNAVSQIPEVLRHRIVISMFADRTADGIASLVEDDTAIGAMAAQHLLSTGLKDFAAFAYNSFPFSIARITSFQKAISSAGGTYHSGGEFNQPYAVTRLSDHLTVAKWLSSLKKPCGIFACCDNWARAVAHHCDRLGIRLPEDVALIGADNDHMQCELVSPPISSVGVPWHAMGRQAAALIRDALDAKPLPNEAIRVHPTAVIVRRSSETLAVGDPDVAEAVTWIREHATRNIGVSDVLRAIPVYRRKLERRFRAVLGRTILEEIRRARVEMAKRLLTNTSMNMPSIATRCGFANATRLAIAFHKETGLTPGRYRRDSRSEIVGAEIVD